VGAGDELGQAGGAPGEQEHRDVAAAGRLGVPAGSVAGRIGGRAADLAQVGTAGEDLLPRDEDAADAQLVGQRLVIVVGDPVGHRDGGGLGVLDQVGQLGAAVRGQRHHRHDPGAQAGQGQDHELPAVGQLHHDAVTRADAEVAQPRCGGVGALGQPGVGQLGVAVDEGRGVGGAVGDLEQQVAQRTAAPPALRDVVRDVGVGPCHGALSDRCGHRTPPR
jgi:hypothetical protein